MTFSTRNFDPLTPLAPKFPNFATLILLFRLKHTVAVVTYAHVLQHFYTTWILGVTCQKQPLGPKLEGGWARGASKKIGTPYLFLQPLKLATSDLVQNLGLGLAHQKTTIRTKIGRGLGQGSIRKIWDPLRIFATVEASNFKFGTQLWFGTSLPKTTFWTKIGGGLGQGSIQTKFVIPYVFLQPLKLTTSNVVHKLGLGLA